MVIESESPRARRYVADVEPKSEDNVMRMVHLFRTSVTREDLREATVLFLQDMSYARADITLALGFVEREKDWA